MKKKQQCAACHNTYPMLRYEPFCSQRCEELFHEHAPIELIDEIYKPLKKEKKDDI